MAVAQKVSLTVDAYGQLKEEIRSNRFPPGGTLTEPEIAIRLGMSRTPVREALIRLESEGLVQLIPRRGAKILPIRADDMREIYEILTALEPEAAANLASRNLATDVILPLDQATSDMEEALDKNDLDQWAEADDRFHQLLLEINGNHRLIGFVSSLYDQAHRARMVTLRLRKWPVKSTEEHRQIVEYLRVGNAELVWETFRKHRMRAMDELLGILESYKLSHL